MAEFGPPEPPHDATRPDPRATSTTWWPTECSCWTRARRADSPRRPRRMQRCPSLRPGGSPGSRLALDPARRGLPQNRSWPPSAGNGWEDRSSRRLERLDLPGDVRARLQADSDGMRAACLGLASDLHRVLDVLDAAGVRALPSRDLPLLPRRGAMRRPVATVTSTSSCRPPIWTPPIRLWSSDGWHHPSGIRRRDRRGGGASSCAATTRCRSRLGTSRSTCTGPHCRRGAPFRTSTSSGSVGPPSPWRDVRSRPSLRTTPSPTRPATARRTTGAGCVDWPTFIA